MKGDSACVALVYNVVVTNGSFHSQHLLALFEKWTDIGS